MDIFLLRHAESEANSQGDSASGADDKLSENGLRQAQVIVDSLKSIAPLKILCSPYPRALETITPFAKATGLPIEVLSCLAEGHLVLKNAVVRSAPKYFGHSSGHKYPVTDETDGNFFGRVEESKKAILSCGEDRVLIVTHGHMVRELINSILHLPSKVRFPHKNCGLTYLTLGTDLKVQFIKKGFFSNKTLQLTARIAGAIRVPSAGFACSGGN